MAQASLETHGLDPRNRRFCTRLHPGIIRAVTRQDNLMGAAHILDLMAEARAVPDWETAQWAGNLINNSEERRTERNPRSANHCLAIRLMFRESEAHQGESPQILS